MINKYLFTVEGTDRDNKPWTLTGSVDDVPGELFHRVPQVIGNYVFMQLTKGTAVFGFPGTTCNGPYKITKFVITQREVPDHFHWKSTEDGWQDPQGFPSRHQALLALDKEDQDDQLWELVRCKKTDCNVHPLVLTKP